jgi:hypothetical protein
MSTPRLGLQYRRSGKQTPESLVMTAGSSTGSFVVGRKASRDYCQIEIQILCMSTRLQGIEACRLKLMNALHLEEGANEARRYGIFS